MKKIILLLLLLLVVVMAIVILRNLSNDSRPNSKQEESRSTQAQVVLSTKQWKNEDREMLEDWVEQLGDRDPGHENKLPFHATLKDGETLITEVQELEAGSFSFTQLTPEQTPEGHILIKAQRTIVDLDGDTKILSAPRIILKDGSTGRIAISSGESFYQIGVTARKSTGSISLSGEVKHETR